MSLAVVIIASEKRRETTFPRVLESARDQSPDEIVVVADFPVDALRVRSLVVPVMTRTTIDALVKRDVGWIASKSDNICYLCDDHQLAPGFVESFKQRWDACPCWDILVPSRFCLHDGVKVDLATGQDKHYAGGHCAIYRRECGYLLPWSTVPHHPNWDVFATYTLTDRGSQLVYTDTLAVEDLEPEAEPWHMTDEQRLRHEAFHQSLR